MTIHVYFDSSTHTPIPIHRIQEWHMRIFKVRKTTYGITATARITKVRNIQDLFTSVTLN